MNLKETYNRIAEDWAKDHENDTWWQEGTDTFVSYLKPGSLVLDMGSGSGNKSRYLYSKGMKVIGADFSEQMVEIARRSAPAIDFRVADITDLSMIPESFDAIFVQAVLLHIPKATVGAVIQELKSKLKEGGYLYIAVKEMREGGNEEEIARENDYGYQYERFFSYYTLPEIRKYLLDAGLEVIYESISLPSKTRWIQVIAR